MLKQTRNSSYIADEDRTLPTLAKYVLSALLSQEHPIFRYILLHINGDVY